MKQIITTFFALFMAIAIWAQAPQAFNYQAVIRDADGNLLENQAVGIKISLLQGSSTGQEVYAETHATTTNPFGQVDLKIGTGTLLTGQFDTISWGAGPYYLQLAVDLTGGTNYAVMGTTQMLSVPYAIYAEEGSGWEKTDEGITYLGGKVGIGKASLTGSNTNLQIQVSDSVDGGLRIFNSDPSANNEALFRIDANVNKPNTLRVQRDGKVGIGTANPATQLEVAGNIRISNGWRGLQLVNDDQRYDLIVGSSTSDNRFGIWDDTQSEYRMYINGDGNVGIGTTAPITSLHVRAGSSGYSSTNLEGLFVENQGVSNSSFVFQTATAGGGKSFVVTNAGNVGIGTLTVTYPLTVNGTIRSKKVIVDTGWSDFVFEDDYSLMPLQSLAKFIEKNNHLPEMPTAKEVEANGISLGDMDAKLLQKIEELTLYTIEQQKMIDELQKEVKRLKRR